MPNPNLMKLIPGSEAAKEHGCICTIDPHNSEIFYVKDTCPVHWPLPMVHKNAEQSTFMKNAIKTQKHLYWGLISIGIILLIVYLST